MHYSTKEGEKPMLTSIQVYMQVLIKVIEDAQRKANAYTVIEFDRCDTWFLIRETINPKEV